MKNIVSYAHFYCLSPLSHQFLHMRMWNHQYLPRMLLLNRSLLK